ncbi:TetR family transcriptional regulator [Actinoplanes ianthinogenes]|uniref:TetR family transcriptional regulator n=1 Tax=Actinoplanes ianthinogenes TaxID=122358 RepID=A0ABN6CJI1_9ACTN|nr:TetR/AcrR family transcriptional regulator [Actinoplanes ianthinogenes]BCJ45053.1 TetR family transcriptional regulator [Actinoplanes ianthinogenes]GGR52222.1 TetR family transcriptional regulator [Actinoplanes ianthinogenes]
MKTRPYHHGDLRAALLALAEDTLRDRGPGELSLRELARAAGVSPAAPSRHFRTKQALLDALALEGFDRLTAAMTEALARTGDSFGERLTALTRTYVTFAIGNPALLELMFSRKHEPTAPAELIEATQRLMAMATGLIEDGQRRGEVREGPVIRLAVPLAAVLQGMTDLALSGGFTEEQVEEGLVEMIDFIRRGYRP